MLPPLCFTNTKYKTHKYCHRCASQCDRWRGHHEDSTLLPSSGFILFSFGIVKHLLKHQNATKCWWLNGVRPIFEHRHQWFPMPVDPISGQHFQNGLSPYPGSSSTLGMLFFGTFSESHPVHFWDFTTLSESHPVLHNS